MRDWGISQRFERRLEIGGGLGGAVESLLRRDGRHGAD